ncbi:hypothetical protein FB567DRAFT_62862 [Paraphoma chrysanthemicola]|uniref:ABM domain-containing protein n=1 Tax=Paraphoma chrysanthemicola TaxID=798071 RepID=A0A8K0R7C9_9PLEO|nr:hypothetical protein FB567DRAFT_62862 [Paraphoma chrysanthemicola]
MVASNKGQKPVVVFWHLAPRDGKMSELLDALNSVQRYVSEYRNTISCFYLLREKKAHTASFILVFCFNSRQDYGTYVGSEAKARLDESCNTRDLLREPQREQHLEPVAGFSLRPNDPHPKIGIHVAMARIQYAPGTRIEGIEHWKHVAASVAKEEEEGTYTYWFLADPEDEDVLYSLERYKDEKYLWDVHVPSKAIQENMKNQKHIRTGLLLRDFESSESDGKIV